MKYLYDKRTPYFSRPIEVKMTNPGSLLGTWHTANPAFHALVTSKVPYIDPKTGKKQMVYIGILLHSTVGNFAGQVGMWNEAGDYMDPGMDFLNLPENPTPHIKERVQENPY